MSSSLSLRGLRRPLRVATLLASSLISLTGAAVGADYLAAEPMSDRKVRLDGMLQEWPSDFPRLKQTIQGSSQGGRAIVGYDDEALYLAADLRDDAIARTQAAGAYEDHLSLELFVPARSGKGGKPHRIDVYPGLPGKLPGVVKVDGRVIKQAQAIEAPSDGGFSLEARIPWSSLGFASEVRVGLRGRLVYLDASRPGKTKAVIATSKSKGASMPALTLEAETGLFQALIEPKGLPPRPAHESYGDLTGNGSVEHVAVYGHYLSIVGPGYKQGKQFYFSELDVSSADRVRKLELRDLDGDGKDEIILEKRLGPEKSYRDVLVILRIRPDGVPAQALAVEVGLTTESGSLRNKVQYKKAGKQTEVVVSQDRSTGLDPETFREPTIGGGIVPALLPWEAVKSRSFSWKGQQLVASGVPQTAASPPPPASPSTQRSAPPPPRPPSSSEMQDRLYALYRQNRGVKQQKPHFDLVTDVAEDSQMERVLVHDRDLVVFGQGYLEGRSYAYLTLGVESAKDVLSLTTRDLVGDGKAEIIVHALLRTRASKNLGGDIVQRQALFVYKVDGQQITRIFAAETGRSLDGKRILGSLAFLPRGQGTEIRLDRLRAVGFTKQNYPFPEDAHPAGGLEPLLLPWGNVPARRYVFDGSAYVLR